ncbi:MAG TPA: shikimate kinase [Candidatus Limnocylindria bacterium]|nr:shikimate kinase [Candidatus Limnocylindria bacterium]
MRRVSMVGNSGSGKSTVGRAVAAALAVPYVEIDALYHQPGWQQLPAGELLAAVDSRTRGDGWVVDGNYSDALDLVWSRADTVVWLDLPRWLVMRQVGGRTARRLGRREELWNGNRGRLRAVLNPDPHQSIVRWAWTRHAMYAERYESRTGDPRWSGLDVVRLRSRADVDLFLGSLPQPPRR